LRRLAFTVALPLALAACGSTTPSSPHWIVGAWTGPETREQWTEVDGLFVGVGFGTAFFEVLIVDEKGLRALPNGKADVTFPAVERDGMWHFANPKHDAPKTIRYTRRGQRLEAWTDESGPFVFEPAKTLPAPELEEADRAFARDTAARGVEGWVSAFDAEGAIWRGGRIEGLEAIRKAMGPILAGGPLRWEPVASGLAPDGQRGYTVGRWTLGATKGVYVSIWRRQPDGTWKVLFDVGTSRPERKP
jgi:hypothetical protein